MLVNLVRRHYAQGGSTLTQQLARNVYLSSRTSMVRKIREAMTAVQIESYYTKKEILELYLNQVYFGAGVYGVEAASRCYFNKTVSSLISMNARCLPGSFSFPNATAPISRQTKNGSRRAGARCCLPCRKCILSTQRPWKAFRCCPFMQPAQGHLPTRPVFRRIGQAIRGTKIRR